MHPKRYNSINDWMKKKFGGRVYKVSLESGCSCPNRDENIGKHGCIFCNMESYNPASSLPSFRMSFPQDVSGNPESESSGSPITPLGDDKLTTEPPVAPLADDKQTKIFKKRSTKKIQILENNTPRFMASRMQRRGDFIPFEKN